MINLLPPIEKTKRAQEKTLKLIWILGILIVASVLCFSLILLSIRFYIADQVRTQEALIEMEKQKNSQVQILQAKIRSVNRTLSELNNFYQDQFAISDFLARLSTLLRPGMHLESFSYHAEGSRIILSGYASNIDEAHEFRERLRRQEDFKEINFTLPDWLQPEGTNFRASFIIKLP